MKRTLLLVALLVLAGCMQQAPPPAAGPMPAAAPPAPPTYIVYFDWNSARIGHAGLDVLRHAAAAYQAGRPVHVTVTGYADRSGSPGYNQRLSQRRAGHVAAALGHLGVPRKAIIVRARGENDNRVATPDGVREPQNRRVEIVEG